MDLHTPTSSRRAEGGGQTTLTNNERKARFIAAALSGDSSIRRLEDLDGGQANQFAMAKAIASGDQRLMQKAGLEADIARLERLQAAHRDDQLAIRRQMRDAERDIEHAKRRIADIGADMARRVPTMGDAFRMVAAGEPHTERKLAGRALMKEIITLVRLRHAGEIVIATIGGFDLVFEGQADNSRRGEDYQYGTHLARTGVDHEIDLPLTVTPLGAVARLEHALNGFDDELSAQRRRSDEATARLKSYRSREGGVFAFAGELEEKRSQLEDVERELMEDARVIVGQAA